MDERIRQLLTDYIRNKCSPEQLEEVYTILEKGGYEGEWKAALLATEKDYLSPPAGSYPQPGSARKDIPLERLFNRISQSIGDGHADITKPSPRGVSPSRTSVRRLTWIAAASVILLLATGISYFLLKDRGASARMMEAVTGAGRQKTILLADGSTIWLNNTSRVRYPESFTGNSRDVYLEGEGFFEIAPDAAKPFHVHAGSLDIHVLGTSFDVRAYDPGKEMAVAVATGKVSVTSQASDIASPGISPSPSWQLLPGDRLVFHNGQGRLDKTDPTLAQAWKDGVLVFKEERLEDICVELERWYGVKIQVRGESLKEKRITLKQQRESLRNTLEVIRMITSSRYTYTEKGVIITTSK